MNKQIQLKSQPHVMPNIDRFLNSVDIAFEEGEVYVYGGKEYVKVWYYDNNGLYKWVWDKK